MTISNPRLSEIPDKYIFDFNVFGDPRVGSNVHDDMSRLLHEAPEVFYTPANGGHWVARSFDAIKSIVQDPECFSVKEMNIPRIENPPKLIPLHLDPPENLPFRQILMPMFSPKPVKKMEDKIRYWAKEIISDVVSAGKCNFVDEVSIRFPLTIFMALMGMPFDRLREFRELSEKYFAAREAIDIQTLAMQINGIMGDFIEQKKATPDDGIISHLLGTKLSNGRFMATEEIQNMCMLLFLGGMDTVANNAAFAFRQLALMPELQSELSEDPSLIPKFVEESYRAFGVICTPRIVAKDCERFGVGFKEGDMMLCMLPLSGRDPNVTDNPNTFDIHRSKREYLTFSSGPHLCVGAFLARTELRILTEEWLKVIPRFTCKEGLSQKFHIGMGIALEALSLEWNNS
jgi:cytochrome P450